MKQNKNGKPTLPAGRYFKYAIGEIILVVIGILIALQINTLNQNRINRKTEIYYLNQLQNDLIVDSLFLFQKSINFEKKPRIIQTFLAELHKENNQESFNKAFRGYINNVLEPMFFVSSSATYNEMESSAKLGIIRDKELRNKIVTLYNHLDLTENSFTMNSRFMSSLDQKLISGRGLANYQHKQNDLFSPYISEDELYELKSIKSELMSNAANWNWTIADVKPIVEAQLEEIRDVIARVDDYLNKNGEY